MFGETGTPIPLQCLTSYQWANHINWPIDATSTGSLERQTDLPIGMSCIKVRDRTNEDGTFLQHSKGATSATINHIHLPDKLMATQDLERKRVEQMRFMQTVMDNGGTTYCYGRLR